MTITEATQVQIELRQKVIIQPIDYPVSIIAGADISFNKFSTTVYAGIVLLSFPGMQVLGYSLVKKEVHFPYVPGYLAFREVPALLDAWEQLPFKPDLLVVDGHGIAHPRRMGIAAHFGVVADTPALGCTKKVLCGKYEEPGLTKGSFTPLIHKDEIIGAALRTKDKVKPVFVSPGNKIDLQGAISIINQCAGRYRLPEPTRQAHNAVNEFRKGNLPAGFTPVP
ncbi:deoxyribonuclease V [Chitinophaga sp.]|uniref:deoxyribonuclease V n=1 Tax=Chitinophaga sp. TaxID=1869181 RepID=UPI0031E2558F